MSFRLLKDVYFLGAIFLKNEIKNKLTLSQFGR